MMSRRPRAGAMVGVALLLAATHAGCAIRRDMVRAELIEAVKRDFPDGTFLVGFGYGRTPEEAEEHAVLDVASSIQSTISNLVRVFQTGQSAAGKKSGDLFITNETTKQVTSDVGAFIRPLRERTRKVGERYVAVAVANRKDLEGKWKIDEGKLLSRVASLWKRVIKLGAAKPESVGPLLFEAECLEQKIDNLDPARLYVTKTTGWTEELVRAREASEQVRAALRMPVQLVTDASGRMVAEQVRLALRERAIAAQVTAEGAVCADGELQVRLLPDETCAPTLAGDLRCEARLTATAKRCGANDTLFSLTSDLQRGGSAGAPELAAFATSVEVAILRLQGTGCRPGLPSPSQGTNGRGLVAVLPPKIENGSDATTLRGGLEESLRALAVDALGPQGFDVLTPETSSALLASRGVDPDAMMKGTPLDIARAMKATHFVASVILKEGEGYVVYARLYDAGRARLVNQITVEGASLRELRHRLTEAAPKLFDLDPLTAGHVDPPKVSFANPPPPVLTAEPTIHESPDASNPERVADLQRTNP